MGYSTVVVSGIDSSLTSTGIARVTWEPNGHVQCDTFRITSSGNEGASLQERMQRLRSCRQRTVKHVSGSDLVVIEGPASGVSREKGGHRHDRSGLWWQILDMLDEQFDVPVAEVAPTARAKYATGNGQAGKDAVLAAVVKRYTDWDVTGNDVADAVLLAAMGARHIGRMIDKPPQLNLAAMTKVRWPVLPVGVEKRGSRE